LRYVGVEQTGGARSPTDSQRLAAQADIGIETIRYDEQIGIWPPPLCCEG
jgi:hypothetical protein